MKILHFLTSISLILDWLHNLFVSFWQRFDLVQHLAYICICCRWYGCSICIHSSVMESIAPWIGSDSDTHQGIITLLLCHSPGVTPPGSVNVVEWVRAGVLISKRAEVTLLHSSSGPLSLIANRVSGCRWHAKDPCMIKFMLEHRMNDGDVIHSPSAALMTVPQSASCQPVCFVLPKVVFSCRFNAAIKCWSRIMQPFSLTWCNSH